MMQTFDLFGRAFNFTINKKRTFKTSFGGLMTIICLAVCIIISLIMGHDFYFRTNPKVLVQSGLMKEEPLKKIANHNFSIAWRIEDPSSNFLDFENVFFPKINFYSFELDKSTQDVKSVLKEKIYLNTTRCSDIKEPHDPYLLKHIDTDQWYCFDFSSMSGNFGGYWNADFLYYYSLSFETCNDIYSSNSPAQPENDKVFNNKAKKCANITQLNNFIKQEVYLSLMLPQVVLNYDSIDDPLEIIYRNSFRSLDLRLSRYEKCDFHQVTLQDDKGWIFKTPANTTGLSQIGSCELSSNFKEAADYAEGENVVFYLVEFYLRKSFVLSQRTFMRIQELAAIMGGFFNIVYMLAGFVCLFTSIFERDRVLMNGIFKFSKKEDDLTNKFAFYKEANQELFKNSKKSRMQPKNTKIRGINKFQKNNFILGPEDASVIKRNIQFYKEKAKGEKYLIQDEHKNQASFGNSFASKNTSIGKQVEVQRRKRSDEMGDSIINNNYKGDYFDDDNEGNNNNNKRCFHNNNNNFIINNHYAGQNKYQNVMSNVELEEKHNYRNGNKEYQNLPMSFRDILRQKISGSFINRRNLTTFTRKPIENESVEFSVDKHMKVDKDNENPIVKAFNANSPVDYWPGNSTSFGLGEASETTLRNLISFVPKNNKSQGVEKDIKIENPSDILEYTNKLDLKENQNNNHKNTLNIREIIEKSKNFFAGVTFYEYYCPSLFIRNNNKNLDKLRILKAFENGKFVIDKKLDLFKYLNHLYVLKILAKLILNTHQRFYLKNNYKYLLNNEEIRREESKLIKTEEKNKQMVQYIENIMEKDLRETSKTDQLIIENIFNQ